MQTLWSEQAVLAFIWRISSLPEVSAWEKPGELSLLPSTEYKGRGADNLRCSYLLSPCKQWVLDEVHLTLVAAFHKNWEETLIGLGIFKSSIKMRHQNYGQIFWPFVTCDQPLSPQKSTAKSNECSCPTWGAFRGLDWKGRLPACQNLTLGPASRWESSLKHQTCQRLWRGKSWMQSSAGRVGWSMPFWGKSQGFLLWTAPWCRFLNGCLCHGSTDIKRSLLVDMWMFRKYKHPSMTRNFKNLHL